MDRIAHLRRLFAYDAWANRETLAALTKADAPPETAVRRFAHVLGTEWLWLSRIRGVASPMAVWPALSLSDADREIAKLAEAHEAEIVSLSMEGLARRISYRNSKGEPWESAVDDIFEHVVVHGAHHRGQIVSDVRAAGFEPPYIDFIHAVRKGYVKG